LLSVDLSFDVIGHRLVHAFFVPSQTLLSLSRFGYFTEQARSARVAVLCTTLSGTKTLYVVTLAAPYGVSMSFQVGLVDLEPSRLHMPIWRRRFRFGFSWFTEAHSWVDKHALAPWCRSDSCELFV